jgi:hypothetical protein
VETERTRYSKRRVLNNRRLGNPGGFLFAKPFNSAAFTLKRKFLSFRIRVLRFNSCTVAYRIYSTIATALVVYLFSLWWRSVVNRDYKIYFLFASNCILFFMVWLFIIAAYPWKNNAITKDRLLAFQRQRRKFSRNSLKKLSHNKNMINKKETRRIQSCWPRRKRYSTQGITIGFERFIYWA